MFLPCFWRVTFCVVDTPPSRGAPLRIRDQAVHGFVNYEYDSSSFLLFCHIIAQRSSDLFLYLFCFTWLLLNLWKRRPRVCFLCRLFVVTECLEFCPGRSCTTNSFSCEPMVNGRLGTSNSAPFLEFWSELFTLSQWPSMFSRTFVDFLATFGQQFRGRDAVSVESPAGAQIARCVSSFRLCC